MRSLHEFISPLLPPYFCNSMRLLIPLCAASLALSGLVACRSAVSDAATPTPTGKNYLRCTLDGRTYEYTDVSLAQGQLGALQSYHIEGGAVPSESLSLTIYGTKAGTFPYRPTLNAYENVSQVTFQAPRSQFNNYKALICPTMSGYYSTAGQVVVTEYVPGKLARGTFSGALLDAHDPDECNKQGKAFSGEFYVAKN